MKPATGVDFHQASKTDVLIVELDGVIEVANVRIMKVSTAAGKENLRLYGEAGFVKAMVEKHTASKAKLRKGFYLIGVFGEDLRNDSNTDILDFVAGSSGLEAVKPGVVLGLCTEVCCKAKGQQAE